MLVQSNPTYIDRTNIVGEWLLDGNANDTSGNGNDGVATNLTWLPATQGYVKECGSCNGSSSSIKTSLNLTISGSIDIFFNADTWGTGNNYSSGGLGTNTLLCDNIAGYIRIASANEGELKCFLYDVGFKVITLNGLNALQDYKLTIAWGVSQYTISLDGVPVTTIGFSGLSASTSGISIGTSYKNDRYWNGKIGLVRAYDVQINTSEANILNIEANKQLGPTNTLDNLGFKKYSTDGLEIGKVLEISIPQSGGVYYNQTGAGNNGTPTSVIDTPNKKIISSNQTPITARYIRDWAHGSTVNTGNHWVEIKANDGGTNRALGLTATSPLALTNPANMTDGSTATTSYTTGVAQLQYVELDLGAIYSLDNIQIWHYYGDGRAYHNTKTEVSDDGITRHTVFDSSVSGEYAETSSGKTYTTITEEVIEEGLNNIMGFNGISSKINLGSSLTIADVKSFACTLEKDTVDNKFILDLGVTGNANNYSWGVIKFNLDTIYIYYMTHIGGIGNGVSFPFDITNKPTRIGLQFSGIREYNNSNGFKCFVNGVEQVTTSIADHNYTYPAVSGDSHIGMFKRTTLADRNFYNGGIINPEIYNRNLTATEWQQDFYKNFIQ